MYLKISIIEKDEKHVSGRVKWRTCRKHDQEEQNNLEEIRDMFFVAEFACLRLGNGHGDLEWRKSL